MDRHQTLLLAYRLLGGLALAPALAAPVIRGRFGGRWGDRLGFTLCGGNRPLWIHGASVGEAKSALEILSALPEAGCDQPRVLSVGTPAGLATAQNRIWPEEAISNLQFPNAPFKAPISREAALAGIQLMAPPLDFWGAPGRFLDRLNPRALVIVETEIWPELLHQCRKRSVPVMIVSGRLGERSTSRYLKIISLISPLLQSIAFIAAISEADKKRFVSLGASPGRVAVLGSPKYDSIISQARLLKSKIENGQDANLPLAPRPRSSARGRRVPLVVAGSTHPGEEELILSAMMSKLPEKARLILAPRHVNRASEIASLVRERGFKPRLWSEDGEAFERGLWYQEVAQFGSNFTLEREATSSESGSNASDKASNGIFAFKAGPPLGKQSPAETGTPLGKEPPPAARAPLEENFPPATETSFEEKTLPEVGADFTDRLSPEGGPRFKERLSPEDGKDSAKNLHPVNKRGSEKSPDPDSKPHPEDARRPDEKPRHGIEAAGKLSITILDQVGMLTELYAHADLCVVGGSFLRGSGHNPLEPASLGKPVVFGPHMSSFAQESEALVSLGAALQVTPDSLRKAVDNYLSNPDEAKLAGLKGLEIVASMEPVAPVLAKLIVDTLIRTP